MLLGALGAAVAAVEAVCWGTSPHGLRHTALEGVGDVLVVVSHPDDECMFFGPAIRALVHQRTRVHLLCLSNGNFEGLGKVREKELARSCEVLGVHSVEVVSDPGLQDGPANAWEPARVAAWVGRAVKTRGAHAVITFDDHGVSGHPNHIATAKGVRHFRDQAAQGHGVVVLALQSVALVRKYLGVLELPWSLASATAHNAWRRANDHIVVADVGSARAVHRCMRAHASQYVWFRRLFVVFSRFVTTNTLEPL